MTDELLEQNHEKSLAKLWELHRRGVWSFSMSHWPRPGDFTFIGHNGRRITNGVYSIEVSEAQP